MIRVTPRSRTREDRAGDPLDGLVNLFDLGIVLAVAFLLAALASLNLTGTLSHGLKPVSPAEIHLAPGETVHVLPSPGASTAGPGTQVGVVYRLPSGQLVYVTGTAAPSVVTTPTAPVVPSTPAVSPSPSSAVTPSAPPPPTSSTTP
jgi:hypothetical protein